MDLIGRLHQKYQMGIVSVTHDENLANLYPTQYRLVQGKLLS
jgi:ABC-type lipoprotein export system ATPase subunit